MRRVLIPGVGADTSEKVSVVMQESKTMSKERLDGKAGRAARTRYDAGPDYAWRFFEWKC